MRENRDFERFCARWTRVVRGGSPRSCRRPQYRRGRGAGPQPRHADPGSGLRRGFGAAARGVPFGLPPRARGRPCALALVGSFWRRLQRATGVQSPPEAFRRFQPTRGTAQGGGCIGAPVKPAFSRNSQERWPFPRSGFCKAVPLLRRPSRKTRRRPGPVWLGVALLWIRKGPSVVPLEAAVRIAPGASVQTVPALRVSPGRCRGEGTRATNGPVERP